MDVRAGRGELPHGPLIMPNRFIGSAPFLVGIKFNDMYEAHTLLKSCLLPWLELCCLLSKALVYVR